MTERANLEQEWPAVVAAIDAQLREAQEDTRRRYPDAAAPTGLGAFGRAIMESPRFVDAFDGFEGTQRELVNAAGALHGELERLAWFAREYATQKNGAAVPKHLRKTGADKAKALEHLERARKLLGGAHLERIDALIAGIARDSNPTPVVQIEVMALGAAMFGRRGGAASNRGALNGAAIRTISKHVPAERPNRAAIISGLLTLCGLKITPQTVTGTLRSWENRSESKSRRGVRR